MEGYDKYLKQAIEEAKLKIANLKGSDKSDRERNLSKLHWNNRIKELNNEQERFNRPTYE